MSEVYRSEKREITLTLRDTDIVVTSTSSGVEITYTSWTGDAVDSTESETVFIPRDMVDALATALRDVSNI
jgi:hypothetical protein